MNNLNGILLVLLAMAGFTIEDAFIKHLAVEISVGQILIILGIGSSVIFATMAVASRQNLFAREAWSKPALLRAFAEAVAAMGYATALSLVDISTVAAVFQATPLAITMGAALFLGEQVGWRRWCAIIVGFIGVLLIIRPGMDGFNADSLFVLLPVFGVAFRDLITRKIDSTVASSVVSFQGFASLIIAGTLMMLVGGADLVALNRDQTLWSGGAILFGAIGYWGIVQAMRVGEVSAIMPFRYSRLIFSITVGVVIFNERPDAFTLIGAGLIIATGLYSFLRERRLVRIEHQMQ